MGNNYDLKVKAMQEKIMSPPRPVPLGVQIGNYFTGMKSQIGWMLLAVGLMVLGINVSIGEWSLFGVSAILIFFVAAIVLIYLSLKEGRLHNYLLANGVLTTGRLIDKQSTATKINNRRVYKLIYEYTADDGKKYQTTLKTHRTDRFPSGEPEAVIHFPGYGNVSALVKGMAAAPDIGEDGTFQLSGIGSYFSIFFRLIVPVVTVVFGSAYLLDWLGIIPLPSFLDIRQILYQFVGGSQSAY